MSCLRVPQYRKPALRRARGKDALKVAHCTANCFVDLPHCNHYLEAGQLKLGAEHFPSPCTLRELVLDRYADPSATNGTDTHTMQPEELLGYLKNTEEFELGPWAAIVNQTEAIGDPAQPSPDQKAVLQWLGKAMDFWEQDYPIEEPLVAQLRKIKPLCAALAMVDPDFLFPGAHPIHQLLDAIQDRAVGWQSTLDRVGKILEQQISKAVEGARDWFEDNDTDLNAVYHEFSKAVERDQSRADRMVQRVIDAELGKLKTQAAKSHAARMINDALEQYAVPQDIEEFLKGPWYTSAQLLLLKFGGDSDQWQKMSETTVTLLDSLQSLENADDQRRQRIFEVVTQLPKEMRRWLLSVHHDTEAVNEAMGQVEFTHLRILRRQPVELVHLTPIMVAAVEETSANSETMDPEDCEEGSWFTIDQGGEAQLRVQLALKSTATSEFLFTNLAGIKVLQLAAGDFANMLSLGKATPLSAGQSFSRSLAKAAGIESAELLLALAEALGSMGAGTLPEASIDEVTPRDVHAAREGAEPTELLHAYNTLTAADTAAIERRPEALLEAATDSVTLQEVVEAPAVASQEPLAEELGVLSRGFRPESAMGEGFLAHQAQELQHRKTIGVQDETPEVPTDEDYAPTNTIEPAADSERMVNLPMGTWLGFHDAEKPMMGRLAVHDPVEDQFVFVNRKGFKLRSLTHAQLLELIDDGLVDILQRSSNLRDQVIEVRNSLDSSKQGN
jgi:hypothetical protein